MGTESDGVEIEVLMLPMPLLILIFLLHIVQMNTYMTRDAECVHNTVQSCYIYLHNQNKFLSDVCCLEMLVRESRPRTLTELVVCMINKFSATIASYHCCVV